MWCQRSTHGITLVFVSDVNDSLLDREGGGGSWSAPASGTDLDLSGKIAVFLMIGTACFSGDLIVVILFLQLLSVKQTRSYAHEFRVGFVPPALTYVFRDVCISSIKFQ